jgi:hypothetical protein
MGCWEHEEVNAPSGLHGMRIVCRDVDIHVVLRPFAQFAAPEYHVAMGPAAPTFVTSADWPWPR